MGAKDSPLCSPWYPLGGSADGAAALWGRGSRLESDPCLFRREPREPAVIMTKCLKLACRAARVVVFAMIAVSRVSAQDSIGAALRGLVVGESAAHRLYTSRGWAPVWLDDQGLSLQGRAAMALLRDADTHGLPASDYATAALDTAVKRLGLRTTSAATLARADLLLSTAMLQYLEDLHSGRARFAPFARPAAEAIDWAKALAEAVAADSVARLVSASEPQLTQYRNLRTLLGRYRLLAAMAQPVLPDGPSVWPGDLSAADLLRRRLQLEAESAPGPSQARTPMSMTIRSPRRSGCFSYAMDCVPTRSWVLGLSRRSIRRS